MTKNQKIVLWGNRIVVSALKLMNLGLDAVTSKTRELLLVFLEHMSHLTEEIVKNSHF